MELAKIVENHDGAGNREIETRYEAPLRNLDDEFGVGQEFRRDASDLRSEEEARTVRVLGLEEIGRLLGELHRYEIPPAIFDMGPEGSDVRRQLDDLGEEIGEGTNLGIPGYENLIAIGNVLYGNAAVYVDAETAGDYPF